MLNVFFIIIRLRCPNAIWMIVGPKPPCFEYLDSLTLSPESETVWLRIQTNKYTWLLACSFCYLRGFKAMCESVIYLLVASRE